MTSAEIRPSWDDYFLEFAKTAASRSTCLRVPDGVGAVLVRDKQILSTGYAGSIRGAAHCTAAGCLIDEKTGGCVRTVHAEVNAILQAAQHGVSIKDSALYTTMSPCWDCFKQAVNGGVRCIVYLVEYRNVERQREFAKELGIGFKHVGELQYVPGEKVWSDEHDRCTVCFESNVNVCNSCE